MSVGPVDGPDARDNGKTSSRRKESLTVSAQFVVIDGPDGEALQERQVFAIRQALYWLATHPRDLCAEAQGGNSGDDEK